MQKNPKFKLEVVNYINDCYPDIAHRFTDEIIDEIVEDCIRNTDDENDPFTTLCECDYNNDWIIGFIKDENNLTGVIPSVFP